MTDIVAHTTTLETTVQHWSHGHAIEVNVSVKVFAGPVENGTETLKRIIADLTTDRA